MGYKIAYSPEDNRKYPMHKLHPFPRKWIVPTVAATALIIAALSNSDAIGKLLLPGDPDVTQAAITTMVEDVKTGTSLPDAITAFCREIIQNAGLRG